MFIKYFGGTSLAGSEYELYAEVPDTATFEELDRAAIDAAANKAAEFWSDYCVVVEEDIEMDADDWAEEAVLFFDEMISSAAWMAVSAGEYAAAWEACSCV